MTLFENKLISAVLSFVAMALIISSLTIIIVSPIDLAKDGFLAVIKLAFQSIIHENTINWINEFGFPLWLVVLQSLMCLLLLIFQSTKTIEKTDLTQLN
jgi:hypothetical protein